jgi:hypothetical protein
LSKAASKYTIKNAVVMAARTSVQSTVTPPRASY